MTELIERKCDNCGMPIVVSKDVIRESIFCTLKCLSDKTQDKLN